MDTVPHLNALRERPKVGTWYLVPAILHGRRVRDKTLQPDMIWWPVIGPMHEDGADFNFPDQHYHVDVRFLGAAHNPRISFRGHFWLDAISASPLTAHDRGQIQTTLMRPRLRPFICRRVDHPYPHAYAKPIARLNGKYAGRQSAPSRNGWICPHRAIALDTQVPDADGVITCPLHGLRIDAKSGVCIGPPS